LHFFTYRRKRLYAEGVAVERIAEEVGTPVYIYSRRTLKRHYRAFDRAFKGTRRLVCYSVKANSNLSVLETFVREGSGFDVVSAGEIYRCLKAGADPSKIVFSGVGKRDDEIEYALKSGILLFNVESAGELSAIDRAAVSLGVRARVAMRVNPDVDPETHPYISTGLKENKFGMETRAAMREYVRARDELSGVDPVGIDCHIGSQIEKLRPFVDALAKVKKLVAGLRAEGIDIKYLDMGGGLGITYEGERPPHPGRYGRAVIEATRGLGVRLIFEPGRVIAGNAGILLTRVIYTKENAGKNFIIVDAAMNDLARPGLYGSYHEIRHVRESGRRRIKADVVGPICESGDFLARNRTMPRAEPGELLAVMSAGAYGFTMSSNYNSRPRAAEVMVSGGEFRVIRKRETMAGLIRGEALIG